MKLGKDKIALSVCPKYYRDKEQISKTSNRIHIARKRYFYKTKERDIYPVYILVRN